jgi:hypothetical protein
LAEGVSFSAIPACSVQFLKIPSIQAKRPKHCLACSGFVLFNLTAICRLARRCFECGGHFAS